MKKSKILFGMMPLLGILCWSAGAHKAQAAFDSDMYLTMQDTGVVYEGNVQHSSGDGWSYDEATNTLTLDGYDGTQIQGEMGSDFTIKLVGKNTIHPYKEDDLTRMDSCLFIMGGLTISGEGSLSCQSVKTGNVLAGQDGIVVTSNGDSMLTSFLHLTGGCTVDVEGDDSPLKAKKITVDKGCKISAHILKRDGGIGITAVTTNELKVEGMLVAMRDKSDEYGNTVIRSYFDDATMKYPAIKFDLPTGYVLGYGKSATDLKLMTSDYKIDNSNYIAIGSKEAVTGKADQKKYTVTYQLNGGTNAANNPYSFDGKQTVSLYPATFVGYLFGGWYLDNAFRDQITDIKQGTAENLTLYAKWVAIQVGSVSIDKIVNSTKGKLTVQWKSIKETDGYEVVYATSKNFKKAKRVVVKGADKTSLSIAKLKSKGTYYVRIHAFKFDSAGSYMYGKYSKISKVVVK